MTGVSALLTQGYTDADFDAATAITHKKVGRCSWRFIIRLEIAYPVPIFEKYFQKDIQLN